MQRASFRDRVLRRFFATLFFYDCLTSVRCIEAMASAVVQMDPNSDRPHDDMWQSADGQWHMCSHPDSAFVQEYCGCQKFRDAVIGCKFDDETGVMCLRRQIALEECQARGLHTTSRPSDLAVLTATGNASVSTTDTHATPLNYSTRETPPSESVSHEPGSAPSSSSNDYTFGIVLGGMLAVCCIVLVIVLVRDAGCRTSLLNCRRQGANAKTKTPTLSRSSSVSSASAQVIMPSQSEAAMAPLLTPEGTAEKPRIPTGADFGVADDRTSSIGVADDRSSSIMPADLHGLESGDLGKYDENPGPDFIAGKENCQAISSESSVPTDHVSLTIENEAVAVVDASSRFSRPLQNSSLTELLGPVTN